MFSPWFFLQKTDFFPKDNWLKFNLPCDQIAKLTKCANFPLFLMKVTVIHVAFEDFCEVKLAGCHFVFIAAF